jgi:hypothetical protein
VTKSHGYGISLPLKFCCLDTAIEIAEGKMNVKIDLHDNYCKN